jgi:hypothetical protein
MTAIQLWQSQPVTLGMVVWRIVVGLVGCTVFAWFEYVRRNDRVRGAKDRLAHLNRGAGTLDWPSQRIVVRPALPFTASLRRRDW